MDVCEREEEPEPKPEPEPEPEPEPDKPGVTITSPNGGEKAQRGQYYNITWDFDAENNNPYQIYIYLEDHSDNPNCSFDKPCGKSRLIGNKASYIDTGGFFWNVPVSLSGTKFKIFIKVTGLDYYDRSDDYFSIVSSGLRQPLSQIRVSDATYELGEKVEIIVEPNTMYGGWLLQIQDSRGKYVFYQMVSKYGGTYYYNIPFYASLGDWKLKLIKKGDVSIPADGQFKVVR
jgi:hypothetical protein